MSDLNSIKKLMQLMEQSICKVKLKRGGHGTGFFCNISNKIPVLITNNHVLGEDDISPGKKINFSTNNDKQNYEIEIDKERRIYSSRKYDITIIELKNEDCIKPDSLLDIDDNIFNADCNYKNNSVYLLYYKTEHEMSFSEGKIKNVVADEDIYEIEHLCDSCPGSAGGPLINSNDFKVIGMHKSKKLHSKSKIGILLTGAINEFKSQFKL